MAIYLGSTEMTPDMLSGVKAVYLGSSLVWRQHTGTLTPSNGVYIQDTDGYYHTSDDWDGTYTPNGIAIISDNCKYAIALEELGTCFWGGYNIYIQGVKQTENSDSAYRDFVGDANTTLIIDQLKGVNDGRVDGAPAAETCRSFTFPNGSKGYLGAAGEWYTCFQNQSAVDAAFNKCGGTVLHQSSSSMYDCYWTSTQARDTNSWFVKWGRYIEYSYPRDSYHFARPFAVIQ